MAEADKAVFVASLSDARDERKKLKEPWLVREAED
jgi:hypothetical protein